MCVFTLKKDFSISFRKSNKYEALLDYLFVRFQKMHCRFCRTVVTLALPFIAHVLEYY